MKDKFIPSVMILIGLIVAVSGLASNVLDLVNDPEKLKIFFSIGYVIFAAGIIWFSFFSKEVGQKWRWMALGGLFLSTIIFFYWVGTWSNMRSANPDNSNPFVVRQSFENTNDGWSNLDIALVGEDNETKNTLAEDPNFPGSIKSEISSEQSLIGDNSLKIITSVTSPGDYKGFVSRQGSTNSYGIAIYAMVPKGYGDAPIDYIQLCLPSNRWVCSAATDLIPGEWTPIVVDLSQDNEDGELYNQKQTRLAVQWKFDTESSTTFPLYLDAVEIFNAGSR